MELAYKALTKGEGIPADCPICAVENSYKEEVYDEFVKPSVVMKDGHPTAILLSSSTSVRTVQERLQELSVQMSLTDLQERRSWI